MSRARSACRATTLSSLLADKEYAAAAVRILLGRFASKQSCDLLSFSLSENIWKTKARCKAGSTIFARLLNVRLPTGGMVTTQALTSLCTAPTCRLHHALPSFASRPSPLPQSACPGLKHRHLFGQPALRTNNGVEITKRYLSQHDSPFSRRLVLLPWARVKDTRLQASPQHLCVRAAHSRRAVELKSQLTLRALRERMAAVPTAPWVLPLYASPLPAPRTP